MKYLQNSCELAIQPYELPTELYEPRIEPYAFCVEPYELPDRALCILYRTF